MQASLCGQVFGDDKRDPTREPGDDRRDPRRETSEAKRGFPQWLGFLELARIAKCIEGLQGYGIANRFYRDYSKMY